MTKAELVDKVYSETGIAKHEVVEVVEAMIRNMRQSMINRDAIYIRGFGTFGIKHRKAKTGRNITKGTTIQIEARDIPAFKPSRSLLDEMNK